MNRYHIHLTNPTSVKNKIGKTVDCDWIPFLDLYNKEKISKGVKDLDQLLKIIRGLYWQLVDDKDLITASFKPLIPEKGYEPKYTEKPGEWFLRNPLVMKFVNGVFQRSEKTLDECYHLWSAIVDEFKKKNKRFQISKSKNFFFCNWFNILDY